MSALQMHRAEQAPVARIVPAPSPVPSFIVLGRDEGGKAHASWFDADDRPAAERAAALMGMHGLPIDDEALGEIAKRLPRGKLFASGRAFVPFVKGSTFDQLAARLPVSALAGPVRATPCEARTGSKPTGARQTMPQAVTAPKNGEAEGSPASSATKGSGSGGSGASGGGGSRSSPRDWGSLAAGDTVLAMEGPDEGWWEATIVEVREGELVLLRWRDFPETPTFSRRRTALALLHPDRDKPR